MLRYIAYRLLLMIPTVIVVSIVSFAIIQLPPGDFLTSYVANLEAQGERIDETTLISLRNAYGLGQPVYVQYFEMGKWDAARGFWHVIYLESACFTIDLGALRPDNSAFALDPAVYLDDRISGRNLFRRAAVFSG